VETVLIAVVALACPVGMLVMGVCMAKGMWKSKGEEPVNVEELRSEHRRLGAEIERLNAADRDGTDGYAASSAAAQRD
jgi:hypothetical protein